MADHDFAFNLDDFLYKDEARKVAQKEFPLVYFSIYHTYVSDKFESHDGTPIAEKRAIQNYGLITVALAFFALLLAAIDIAFVAQIPDKTEVQKAWSTALPLVAAVSGIGSFLIGFFGAGVGPRKKLWLVSRMKAELIRQWRARYYLNHCSEILRGAHSEQDQRLYKDKQREDFDLFLAALDDNAAALLDDVISGSTQHDLSPWLDVHMKRQDQSADNGSQLDSEVVQQYYAAYREMRFGGQERYARYISQSSGPLRTHPRAQKALLSTIGFGVLLSIVFLHVMVTLGVFTGVTQFKSIFVHLTTVGLALFALGIRAIEDGLRPDEHLGRYTAYHAAVQLIRKRFDRATTAQGKHSSAWALEETAFEEMRDFLSSSSEARYLM